MVAPSFGDIFSSNCFQNGMLPVVLPEHEVAALADASARGEPVTVDLPAGTVAVGNATVFRFILDPLRREMLLAGTDELGLTLRRAGEIAAWQAGDAARRPWAVPHPPTQDRAA